MFIKKKQLFLSRSFLVLCLLFSCLFGHGQIQVFKSYNDYLDKKFESFDDVNYSNSSLTFQSSDNKTKYKYDEIWGFTFDKYLYRTNKNDLYQVLTFGKIVSYTNGEVSLKLRKGKTVFYTVPSEVATTWISSGLNNDIYLTGFNPYNSKPPKKYRSSFEKFQSDYPEHQKFYNCIDGSNNSQKLQQCLSDYNDNIAAKFEKALIDLGEIKIDYKKRDEVKPIVTTYTFINSGKEPIILESVTTKVDFIAISFSKVPVLPNEKGQIIVTLDVQKYLAKDKPIKSKGTYTVDNSNNIEVRFKNITDVISLILKETLVLKV